MKTFTKKEYIILLLRDLEDGGNLEDHGLTPGSGICFALNQFIAGGYFVGYMAADYESFSGDDKYPIPAPSDFISDNRVDAASQAFVFLSKWEGEYGDMRREYAGHCANWIEEYL